MKADYEMMTKIYENLNNLVDNMVDNIKEIKSIVNSMDGKEHWNGNGYSYFNKKISNLCQNFGSYCNDLYTLNNNIVQSVEKLKEVDKQLMKG